MLEIVLLVYAISSPRNASSIPLGWFKEKKILMICERVWEKGPYGAKIEIEI